MTRLGEEAEVEADVDPELKKKRIIGTAIVVLSLGVIIFPFLSGEQQPQTQGIGSDAIPLPAPQELSVRVKPDAELQKQARPDLEERAELEPLPARKFAAQSDETETAIGLEKVVESEPVVADVTKQEEAPVVEVAKPKPVVAPAPPPPVKVVAQGKWIVQLASFSKSDNASRLQQRLAAKGYQVMIDSLQRGAGTVHRVRVGPVATREDGKKLFALPERRPAWPPRFCRSPHPRTPADP